MLTQPTIEKLYTMRLSGMAEAFQQQQEDANIHVLSFEERLGLLIDRQWNWRQNRALERRLRIGRLKGPACVEDIDYRTSRSGPATNKVADGRIRLGPRTSEFVPGWANRNRQDLAGAGVCAEGVPRRLLGVVP
jgi:hypothetical protein